MGTFGKYVLQITCSNGRSGYYMGIHGGCIELTRNAESAERFMTRSGARGYASGMDWSMPTYDGKGESTVVSVDLYELG